MHSLAGTRLSVAAALGGVLLLAACAPMAPSAALAPTPAAGAPAVGPSLQAAAAAQPAAAAPASPPPLTHLIVGYGSAGGGYIPLWIAAEARSFERYGL